MCTGELVNLSWTSHTMYSWTSHTMTTVGFSYWPLGSLFDTSLDKVSIATDHLPYLHCYLTLTYLVGRWSAGFSYSANLYSLSYTTVLAFVPGVTLISIGLALQQSMNLNPIGLVYYPGPKSSSFTCYFIKPGHLTCHTLWRFVDWHSEFFQSHFCWALLPKKKECTCNSTRLFAGLL